MFDRRGGVWATISRAQDHITVCFATESLDCDVAIQTFRRNSDSDTSFGPFCQGAAGLMRHRCLPFVNLRGGDGRHIVACRTGGFILHASKKAVIAGASFALLGATLFTGTAGAAAKSGGTCAKVGTTEGSLQCKQVGKAKRWVKVTAPVTAAPTTAAPAASAPAATAAPAAGVDFPLTGDSQGVTDTTVKIGIISVVNRGGSAAVSTAIGDETAQINALVEWANANGGIAGRKIIPVVKEINVAGSTFAQSPVICASLTNDEKVFAVILQGHSFQYERECYTKKKVLVIDPSNVSYEDSIYKKLAPFFYSTSTPSYDRWVPSLLKEAKNADFFKGSTGVGIFALDTPDDRALVEGLVKTELGKVGVDKFEVGYSGFDSPLTFFRDAAKAIARFQAAKVDRVILMGQQGLGVAFVLTAEQAKFFPRYLTHSNEVPRYMSDIPRGPGLQPLQPGTLDGAMGIGWTPYQDTDDVHLSFPRASENDCINAMRAKGLSFGSRNLARYAIGVCDGLQFLQISGKPLKALNVQGIAASAGKLGSSWAAPGAYKATFSPGRFDGGGGYRVFTWDSTCGRIADANGNITAPKSGGCWILGDTVKDFPA